MPEKQEKSKTYFQLGALGGYFFRKKDQQASTNINLKMMHSINKIAIIMFVGGCIRFILKKLVS